MSSSDSADPVGVREDAAATITAYTDGPYIVRGAFQLRDQDGAEITVRRRAVALCRCGKSRIRPFCDGTHRLIGFRAPGGLQRPNGAASP